MSDKPSISANTSGKQKEEPAEEDDEYFMHSSFVFFQVERRLFHVPSYRFTSESHVFAGMFRLPQSNVIDVEGVTRDNPIKLPDGIRSGDFRNFMKALYPMTVSIRLSLTKAEWISVLKLSTFWYFLSFRKMAISELEAAGELSSTEEITLGRLHSISSWVIDGYRKLIQRRDTITKEEAITVNYETTFALFRIRELRLSGDLNSSLVNRAIKDEFKNELDCLRAEEKGYAAVEEEIKFEDLKGPNSVVMATAEEHEVAPMKEPVDRVRKMRWK